MKIAITGGTGFMGRHLAARLLDENHDVILTSRGPDRPELDVLDRDGARFVAANVADPDSLRTAFENCDAVAHLAGINFERGDQTFQIVHIDGTRNVAAAAEDRDVTTLVLSSFLRARPGCGSAYHETKWAAEAIVRASDLEHTILKPGITYGPGDQMLDHLSRWLVTVPVFGRLGFRERRMRPLAIEDLVEVLVASATESRLAESTVPVMGPEELTLSETVRRIGRMIDRDPLLIPLPLVGHYWFARVQQSIMQEPITSPAQVRMLAEGLTEPLPTDVCTSLPDDLEPSRPFSPEQIRRGLSDPEPYSLDDLRFPSPLGH